MKSYRIILSAIGILCASWWSLPAADIDKISFPPHTFSLPEGYALKPVAAPPLVQRPIHMYFDEGGALYVTDSSGNSAKAPVQLKNPNHRILRLVDRDGDGVFDHSTVFAENVPFPEGILVHQGVVLRPSSAEREVFPSTWRRRRYGTFMSFRSFEQTRNRTTTSLNCAAGGSD